MGRTPGAETASTSKSTDVPDMTAVKRRVGVPRPPHVMSHGSHRWLHRRGSRAGRRHQAIIGRASGCCRCLCAWHAGWIAWDGRSKPATLRRAGVRRRRILSRTSRRTSDHICGVCSEVARGLVGISSGKTFGRRLSDPRRDTSSRRLSGPPVPFRGRGRDCLSPRGHGPSRRARPAQQS